MSLPELTSRLCDAIRSRRFDAIVCNVANPDMVGHTGDLAAAIGRDDPSAIVGAAKDADDAA